MIVRNFLQWVRTASAGERADATAALARAYLYSDLSPDDLGAAEGAMLMLLDDPSPLVRRARAPCVTVTPGPLSVAQATGAPLDLAAFAAPAAAAASNPASAAPTAKTAAVPDTAGMTGAFAAATPTPVAQAANQMFHGLFQDTDRTAPVAAVVSQLWTTPNATPDGNGASNQPSRRGDMRNLFSDPGPGS